MVPHRDRDTPRAIPYSPVGEAVRELAGWLKTLPGPELDQLLAVRPDARPYQDYEISQVARWLAHPTSVAGAVHVRRGRRRARAPYSVTVTP